MSGSTGSLFMASAFGTQLGTGVEVSPCALSCDLHTGSHSGPCPAACTHVTYSYRKQSGMYPRLQKKEQIQMEQWLGR